MIYVPHLTGNISNALTNKFIQDVGMSQDQFNVGQQLLSCGIVLLEVRSNTCLVGYDTLLKVASSDTGKHSALPSWTVQVAQYADCGL